MDEVDPRALALVKRALEESDQLLRETEELMTGYCLGLIEGAFEVMGWDREDE